MLERKELRNKQLVFDDRLEAGRVLAEMLAPQHRAAPETIVLAIPAGGVPVGIQISKDLQIDFDVVIVRKIQIPGNTEAGFGAMTPEGSLFLNEELLSYLNLSPAQIEAQKNLVKKDLEERNRLFRKGSPFPDLSGKTVILVDDGLASGFTMMAALDTAKRRGAAKIVVAVPTAPLRSIERIEPLADEIYCANIRETAYFAVADAYRNWYDLTREEVLELLRAGP
ncbi:MAG: phosphoribosyltransferase family protein [Desulforhabdus sp.]|jgi:predicted phosphoribosyltransferase|nr:phosphoribosyltransferase family protein [Desulforhabdus sp.]